MIPDETLASQVQRGDRRALDALVERHYDALMGYLYRLTLGDRPLAQDLTQEAFLRALRGIGSYDTRRPFKPWLYAIAVHAARNHAARAEQRRVTALDDDDRLADDAHEADSALQADDEARAVLAALADLPTHQREVITLYYYADLPLSAIAAALDIPLGTVKSRMSLGLARLRQHMSMHEAPP